MELSFLLVYYLTQHGAGIRVCVLPITLALKMH